MIYEIFDCVTGETQGYRATEEAATALCNAAMPHAMLDYLPAKDEGYYLVKCGRYVKGGPYKFWSDAHSARVRAELGRSFQLEIVRHES